MFARITLGGGSISLQEGGDHLFVVRDDHLGPFEDRVGRGHVHTDLLLDEAILIGKPLVAGQDHDRFVKCEIAIGDAFLIAAFGCSLQAVEGILDRLPAVGIAGRELRGKALEARSQRIQLPRIP